jgi:hypothetical protein
VAPGAARRRAALFAGLMVALSRFHVHWSWEIRGYALPKCAGSPPTSSSCAGRPADDFPDLCGWVVAGPPRC